MLVLLVVLVILSILISGCGGKQQEVKKEEPKSEDSKENVTEKWKPERPVEFVVPYSAGGGSDVFARTIVDIIQKKNLVEQPIMVVNKPGGSGQVGMTYVHGKKGDSYTFMTFVTGQVSSALVTKAPVQLNNLTPIVNMCLDEFVLGVKADGKYKNLDDLIKAAKENPGNVSVGGVSIGNEDHMAWALLNNEMADKSLKYVSFNGAGDVMTAILGGHLDAGIFNPNECLGQIEGGQLVPLTTWSSKRLFDDVKTITEYGLPDVMFQQFRGIAGPPDMPKEAIEYWSDVFKQVAESQEFKDNYWGKNLLTLHFIGSNDALSFFENEQNKSKKLLIELGILK